MKRTFILLLFFTAVACANSQTSDSTRKKLNVFASFTINSNGVNPIPSFSLGKPAVQALLDLSRGRLSYNPGLAYGLDAKPWYIDNWFHFMLVDRKVFKLRTGINFSMFFQDKIVSGQKFLAGERYWTGEIAGLFTLKSGAVITLSYWSDNGQDHGSLTGHFISSSIEKNNMRLSDNFSWSAYLQLFTIQYDQDNDGFFITPKIAVSEKHLPLSLFFQATQSIVTKISPDPGFQWDIGLSYLF
jgi:hypothetical protein